MHNRVAVVAVVLTALSVCAIAKAVLGGDLQTNILINALLIATAATGVIWYCGRRTEHVTAHVDNAQREIRTDVVLTAVTSGRRVAD